MQKLVWIILLVILIGVVYLSYSQNDFSIGGIQIVSNMNHSNIFLGSIMKMIIYSILLVGALLLRFSVSRDSDPAIAKRMVFVLLISTILAFIRIGWWLYTTEVWITHRGVLLNIMLLGAFLIIASFHGFWLIWISFLNAAFIARESAIFWGILIPGLIGVLISAYRIKRRTG